MNSPEDRRESSPPTPESSFRELDDAFLQTQAMIWLGEVLDKRFDEAMNINDLLADGQILYELYQVIQKLLGDGIGSSAKVLEWEFVSSREITEKYPYPKVECFLRVCQILGLEDVDLFTSSDVVHKRNTRKVCMCMRSLSKKARLKNLNVPDFDSVTYTINSPVSMPTDMVENRRRNLERSTSPIGSSGQDTTRDSRSKHRQGDSVGSSSESSYCKSNASHDSGNDQINPGVVESIGMPTSFFGDDASSPVISGSLLAGLNFSFVDVGSEPSYQGPEKHKNVEVEGMPSSLVSELVGSPHPNQENDHQLDNTSFVSSVGDNFVQMVNDQSNHDNGSIRSVRHMPTHLSWEDGAFVVEDLEESNATEIAGVSKSDGSSLSLKGKSYMFNECSENKDDKDRRKDVAPGVDSEACNVNGLCAVAVESNGGDDHCSSMKPIDGRNDLLKPSCIGVEHLNSYLNADNTNCKADMPCENGEASLPSSRTVNERMEHQDSCNGSEHQSVLQEHNNNQHHLVSFATDVSPCGLRQVGHLDLAGEGSKNVEDGGYQIYTDCRDGPCTQDIEKLNPPLDPTQGHSPQGSVKTSSGTTHDSNGIQCVENVDKDKTKPVNDENMNVQSKPQKKMTSLMVKGMGTAAVVGLVLLFLQLRGNGGGRMEDQKHSETKKTQNAIAENHSSKTVQERKQAHCVYPSDRLQFRA